MSDVDAVVIGAGVVGLAVARELAQGGLSVIVVEAAEGIGTETSSRNSEVIHAGHLLPRREPEGAAVRARAAAALRFCESHGVPHRRCGKLIVATERRRTRGHRGARAGRARPTALTTCGC